MASHGGESRNSHFGDAAKNAYVAGRLHNGMNEDSDIPRFGADDYDSSYDE